MERYLRVNLLGLGPRLTKKKSLPGRGLTNVEKHCSKLTSVVKYVLLTGYAVSSIPRRDTNLLIDTATSTRLLHRHFELLPWGNAAEK